MYFCNSLEYDQLEVMVTARKERIQSKLVDMIVYLYTSQLHVAKIPTCLST